MILRQSPNKDVFRLDGIQEFIDLEIWKQSYLQAGLVRQFILK